MTSPKNYNAAVSFFIIIFTIYWSIHSLMPNKVTGLNSSNTEFSTERALLHLKEISKKPHYVGSPNHQEVRNYIVGELEKLGLTVEIQTQMAVNRKWRSGTNTKNILARIKGSGSGKSLLLLSHYDSSPHSSLGASDAGSGVVTIIEGIRAFLANNTKHKNDIIILISDAEELGLLGANAFVKNHPWAKDVGLVLNFESRGSGGPSYILMETNGGNKNLVKAFNKANPKYPVGNSLLYSIYKMLPNDTDLTVFREEGNINGFNFAFLDDHYDYHTAQDSYERLDKNTLQHQADYLMPLLTYFANNNLENLSAQEDHVFFNFPGFGLINYPFSWVGPLMFLAALAFIILIFIGLKRKKLQFQSMLIGFVPFLLSLSLSGIITFYSWKLLLKIYPQYNDILHGFTYNGHFYITAFITLTIWLTIWIYSKYLKNHTWVNLFIAPVFIWLVINITIAILLPGAGFLIIPLLLSLVMLALQLVNKKQPNQTIFFSVLSIPILIIFAPLIQMFPIGLGLKMTAISTTFTVLILGILIPVFSTYKQLKKVNRLFLFIGILSLVSAAFASGYSKDKKQPNSILYFLDADKKEAYWTSYNNRPDPFTQQFLGSEPSKGSLVENPSASKYGTNFKMHRKTDLIDIKAPKVAILKDTILGNDRIIHLKITPQRNSNRLELLSNNMIQFKSFSLNGQSVEAKEGEDFVFTTEKSKNIFNYYFTRKNEALHVIFTIAADSKPELVFFESSFNLLDSPLIKELIGDIKPRDESMMPMPFVLNDAIVIKKNITL